MLGINYAGHDARQIHKAVVKFLPADLDRISFDILEEKRNVDTQHERYGMKLPSGDAIGTLLVFVQLLVSCADQLSHLLLSQAHCLPPRAYSQAYMTVHRRSP